MNSRRAVLLLILLLAAVGVAIYRSSVFSTSSPPAKAKLAIVTGGSGAYWQMIANGARAAARDLGVEVDIQMPQRDENLEAQAAILNSLNVDDIDGVALSPLDAEAQTRLIDRLAEKTFVVTIDSDAPFSSRLSYVGASNRAAGQKSGQLVKEAIPGGGKIAVLMANMSKDNMLERKEGFEHEISGEENEPSEAPQTYEVVGYLVDEGDDQRCKEQIRQLLQEHDDLSGIVGLNARHGPILLSVLKEEGALGKLTLVTFDTPEETLAGIEAGHIFATVAQDPYQYGYEAIQLLTSFCRRDAQQLPPPGLNSTMNIATKSIRKENVEKFRRSLAGRLHKETPATQGTPEG